jgi:DNA-binding response OmpR family regulator
MRELVITRHGRRLQRFGLSHDAVVIGRLPECDLVLDGKVVSRYHARLERRGETYEVIDTESRNGVFLTGKRLSAPELLRSGDQFSIADFAITYVETNDADLTQPFDQAHGDGLQVDAISREAWVEPGRRPLTLSKQEFDLLGLMHGNKGRVIPHAVIGEAIWGISSVSGVALPQYDDGLIQRLISRLKSKLAEGGAAETIRNVRGVGYRLE